MPEASSAEARYQRTYRQHHEAVLRYCFRRTARDDAPDAAAEVFVVAWRRLDDLPSGDETLPWLYGVARRVLSNRWRSDRRRARLLRRVRSIAPGQPVEPESVVVQREEDQQVHDALDRLRAGDREVLRLAAWEGLSTREISLVLGCTPQAAEKRLYRAKGRLAHELGVEAHESSSSATAPRQEGGAT
jgi:RNA polymerase sigma factor (sigma-70 family)